MNEVQQLGLELARLKRQVAALAGPQLAHSSLEDVHVNDYDLDGQLMSIIGKQYDGSHGVVTVAGPVPPVPLPPTLIAGKGYVIVETFGEYVQAEADIFAGRPTVAPLDFARFEVHVSTDPDFDGLVFDTLRGTIETARGGRVVVPLPPGVPVYARLVTRTTSGKISAPSAVSGPAAADLFTADDLDIDLSTLGGNHIFYGPDQPTALADGDLWLKVPENVAYGWSEIDQLWIVYRDQGIVESLQQAQAAADEASAASILAGQAQTAADAKITVYRQPTPPSGGVYKVNGDLWIDSDDGLIYYASTTSGDWLATPDQRVATALTNANTANTVVATKTSVFAQISAPSTTGRTVGDVWIDTDDSNRWYDWTGAWTPRQWGAAALNVTARQLGGITTFFQTSQPAAGMVAGDLWIDTDDGNRTYRYETTWVVADDQRIGTALTTATTANTAVATKITVFAQTSAPSTGSRTAGDLWIDTDDANKIYNWDTATTAWVVRQFGASALSADAIDGKTITGAVLRTGASGARLQMDSTNGLRGFGSDGTTVNAQLTTAGVLTAKNATISGTLRSAESGARVELHQELSDPAIPKGELAFYSPLESKGGISHTTFVVAGTSDEDGNLLRIEGVPANGVLVPSAIELRVEASGTGLYERRSYYQSARHRFSGVLEEEFTPGSFRRVLPSRGTASVTTDASGLALINHNLGFTPSVIEITEKYQSDAVSSVFKPTVGAINATQFQLVAMRTDGTARLAGTAVQFGWVAWP